MLADFAGAGQRGRVFGFHRAMDHSGAVLGPLLASIFLYFYPDAYRPLFALTIVPGLIVMLFILAIPESPRPRSAPVPAPRALASAPSLSPIAAPLAIIFIFGLGNASDAFLLLRLSEVGIASFWIPLLWSGLHVTKAAASLAGGELSDRLGRRHLIGAGWLFYAAVYAAFAFVETPGLLVTVFLAYGAYFGLTEGVEKAWIADLAPKTRRATAFGYYNATTGIGALLASLIFGLIWTRVSPKAAFLTGATLAAAATLLLYLRFPDEEDSRHQ
jgi:MFS family permease